MKKIFTVVLLSILVPSFLNASSNEQKGINLLLTSKDTQTQMMSMVLSIMTIKAKKEVRIVLCSNAGDLAVKNIKSIKLKPKNKSPKDLLKKLIKKGVKVQICPLYLPNISKTKKILLEGVTVANPSKVAAMLLDKDYATLSY